LLFATQIDAVVVGLSVLNVVVQNTVCGDGLVDTVVGTVKGGRAAAQFMLDEAVEGVQNALENGGGPGSPGVVHADFAKFTKQELEAVLGAEGLHERIGKLAEESEPELDEDFEDMYQKRIFMKIAEKFVSGYSIIG